jgi:hypothetical protein
VVAATYLLLLAFVLLSNAMIYVIQDGTQSTFWSVLVAVFRQLLQPMLWLNPWTQPALT